MSSYGLAVVVLGFMFVLTYLGTIEQKRLGLYAAQKMYFESWLVMYPTKFGSMPLPGGMLLMGLLALNLLFGGLVRIRKTRRTAGIIVAHIGIAILMAAGLVKQIDSDDGFLDLIEGEYADEFKSFYEWEVAVFDAEADGPVEELLIPDAHLRSLGSDGTRTYVHPTLGFELVLSHFIPNGRAVPVGPMWDQTYPVVDDYSVFEFDLSTQAEANIPAVYAAVRIDGDTVTEGILSGLEQHPLVVATGDSLMALTLRQKRFKMPFTVRLEDFHKEEHPRTDIPSVYRSDITKVVGDVAQPDAEEPLRIEMNRPLRDGGLVVFQASYGDRMTDEGVRPFSQFAIVRNPSDHWPVAACIVIGAGLLIAFTERLFAFVRKQNEKRRAAAA